MNQSGSNMDADEQAASRIALVTGASRGIGRAIAVELGRSGPTWWSTT